LAAPAGALADELAIIKALGFRLTQAQKHGGGMQPPERLKYFRSSYARRKSMAGLKGAFGALLAGSMLFSSTASIAARPAPVVAQQANPWAALAALSAGAPAATMCGGALAAAAAAQGGAGCVLPVIDTAPPPPAPAPTSVPPIAAASPGFGLNPLALGLLALVAGIGIYFAVRDGGAKSNTPT
jgi:hypothetical protein